MRHGLYNLLLLLATPLLLIYLVIRPKYRTLLNRFHPRVPKLSGSPIWVHGASVGEVLSAKTLIQELKRAYPGVPIVLTTGTATGMDEIQKWNEDIEVAWFPFDHPWVVQSFFNRLNPRYVVLIETELWPNVLHRANLRQTPVIIINGRLSEKHFGQYERHKKFFHPYLSSIALAAMQTSLDAERIETLGVPKENIKITGNIKFDGADTKADTARVEALGKELGIGPEMPLVVFGSTRPGEERAFASLWSHLKSLFPQLCVIIAPRHLNRLSEAAKPFTGEVLHKRSELSQTGEKIECGDVILLDTIGELKSIYSLATVAVVGGSFSEDVQGHNPIEPAALGIPTVFGPYMKNFLQAAAILTDCGGAIQVKDEEALLPVLKELLSDPEKRKHMGAHAQEAVRNNKGAIEKTLGYMQDILP